MNIGIVTTWFERGAAYVSRAYFEVLSKDHEIFIYARGGESTGKGDLHWDKKYVTWGKRTSRRPSMFIDPNEFREWVNRFKINILIFNEQHNWEIFSHIMDLDILIGSYVDYYTPETIKYYWLYDFLLCNTHRHFSVFKEHPQVLFIPWGTDIRKFSPIKPANKEKPIKFFHSCGMSPLRKGTDILVTAFKKVQGNAKLIIHSQRDVNEFPTISPIILKDRRISWINADVTHPGLYYLGDVYVYPTKLEGIGLTIPEALASGLPVITTDNPPMNEFVINGLNGLLVPVKTFMTRGDNYYWPQSICNSDALVDAIQYFINNPQKLYTFKLNARQYSVTHLDWNKNAKRLPKLIYNLTKSRHQKQYIKLAKNAACYSRRKFLWSVVKNRVNSLCYTVSKEQPS